MTQLALFTAAYFMSYFYGAANAVIAPNLSQDMNLGAAQLGLMTSLFWGVFTVVQLPIGMALDRWGARWVTPVLMIIGAGGSLVFANAPSFLWLVVGRSLLGLGMGGCLMGGLKTLSEWFPSARFATGTGMLVGIGALGGLVAARPMTWVTSVMGWRVIFVGAAIVTIAIAVAIMIWARNAPPGVEWQSKESAVKGLKKIFTDSRFWRIAPLTFFLSGVMFGFQGLWAGRYLNDSLGLGDSQVGNLLLLLGLGIALGHGFSGWIVDRLGLGRVMRIVVMGFWLSQFALVWIPPVWVVATLFFIFGLTGGFNTMLATHIRRIFPVEMMGEAETALNLFVVGGTFMMQWWLGLIIESFSPIEPGHYPPQAYTTALLITGIGTLLAWAWYWPYAGRAKTSENTPSDN